MGAITLGDVAAALAFVVALGGSIGAIVRALKKALEKTLGSLFDEQTKNINARLDKSDEAIAKLDMDNCKNYIVQALSAAERGTKLTKEELIRLSEEYDHYTKNGGNSYIVEWHNRLNEEGKLK